MKLNTMSRSRNTRSSWRMLCCTIALCLLALTGGAFAQVGIGVAGTGAPGGFAIEGNLLSNSPNVAPYNIASDWTDGPAGIGIGVLYPNGSPKDTIVTAHPIDLTGNDDLDVFKTGSNKVSDNPNSYNWVEGSVPQKDDIGNGYVHFSVDGSGNRWVAVGGDRRAINGDSYIDFEFLQNGLTKNSNGTFSSPGPDSGRTVGDFLLTIELTQGGSAALFFAQKWLPDSSGNPPVPTGTFSYHDVTNTLPPLTAFVAANIDSQVLVPWGAFGSTLYGINQFGEAVANITALTNSAQDPCVAFQTAFIRTKSSQSPTAELKDFIPPITFHICADLTPPQITCPANQNFECSAIGTFNNPTATDNCDSNVTVTEVRDTTPGSCPQEKTIRRIFTATDNCGNTAVCTSFVNITDNTPPQITCPAEQTFECNAVGAFGSASATDNCDASVTITEARDTSGTCPVNIRRIFTATDDCGNSSNCTTYVHIDDTTSPQLTCPAEQTFECNAVGAFGTASATDNCDQNVSISEVRDTSGTCPVNIRRIFTATDDCGNSSRCTTYVHIDDTTPPQLTCAAEQTFQCNSIGTFNSASATDNCDQSVSIAEARDTSGTCPVNIRRIFTATDDCGNSSTCTTFVHIDDTTRPEISCPADGSIGCLDPLVFGTPTATDSCDANPDIEIVSTDSTVSTSQIVYTRTWSATDNCGNTSQCSQTITRNTEAPILTCTGDQITCLKTQGTACVTVTNLDSIPNISYSWSPEPVIGQGTDCATYNDSGLVTVTVTNLDNGCSSSCSARITKNTTPPDLIAAGGTVTCFQATVQLTASSTNLCAKYHWTGPNGFDTTLQNPTVSDSGNYTVTVTDTCNGCTNDTTVHVANVIPQLTDTCGALGPITSGFELDGNVSSVLPNPPDDWDSIYTGGANPTSTTGVLNDAPSKTDDYFQRGSKDLTDVTDWKWNVQSVPDKDDILHGGAAQYGTRLYFFGDRIAVNGDAQIGFWFFKNAVDTLPDGTFDGEHAIGDLLILSNFIKGGGTPVIFAYEWVGSGGSDGALDKLTLSASNSFAIVNPGPVASPWPYTSKFGSPNQFPAGAFFEGGIDLACLPGVNLCFTSFLLETRSSQSVTASSKDFLIGRFTVNSAQPVAISRMSVDKAEFGEKTPHAAIPTEFALHANFPNPFNPTTVIRYELPEPSSVKLSVFNILGQEVVTLVNKEVGAGYQSVEWNTDNTNGIALPSGVYIYRLDATSVSTGKEFNQVRKMVLMK